MGSRAIRVEIDIAADLDLVWNLTQEPVAHTRWDARFSRITPLDHTAAGVWRFRYERRLLLHTIVGTGIAHGTRIATDGSRTSALRFTTGDRWSPLRDGRGFWRYEPGPQGVRFITGFDYEPGWGRALDRIVRPVVAWLTAVSFARLRRWAERDEVPEAWPIRRLILPGRSDRPRAAECRWTIGRPDTMRDAPETLTRLAAP